MKRLLVLLVAVTMLSPALGLAGEAQPKGASADEATTVKGSKSNTSERAGSGGTGGAAPAPAERPQDGDGRARNVKSGKSNSDN